MPPQQLSSSLSRNSPGGESAGGGGGVTGFMRARSSGGGAWVAAALASFAYVIPVGEHEPEARVGVKGQARLAGGREQAVACDEHLLPDA